MDLKEKILRFGDNQRLFGVLTLPDAISPALPVVVIPNTGVEHRVGPNRLHVQLARALANAGYATLRMDVSGLGESEPAAGQAPDGALDLQLALDLLQRSLGARGFALIGLCSGAHDAHQLAKRDARVRAALFIDGYAYPTARHRRRRLLTKLLHPERAWRRVLNRLRPPAVAPPGFSLDIYNKPPQSETASDYARMIERGMQMAFLFSGDLESSYSYPQQHLDAFPLLHERVRIWHLPEADHTLTRRASREEVIARILAWLQSTR